MSSLFSRVYYQTLKDYAYYFQNLNFVLHGVIHCYILFIRGRDMHIIINHSSMIPIYEQIVEAIKEAILSNQLSPNEALPSVRALSKELKISALTVKKAYDFLEKEGYTTTVHGKGSYVLEVSQNEVKENCLRETEELLSRAIEKGKCSGITYQEMQDMLSLIMEDIYDSH